MKFQIGDIQETADLYPEDGWTIVSKPQIWHWQLLAFPVAVINIGMIALLWLQFTSARSQLDSIPFPLPIIGFLFCLVGVLIAHELIHALVHPMMGLSTRSIIGFWPSRMLLYAIYNGELSRLRFMAVLLMPFVILSIVPLVIAILGKYFNFWVAYITILNAFVAAGDILEIISISRQVPANTNIKRHGWDYYWKLNPGLS